MRILRSGAQNYDVHSVSRETGVVTTGDKRRTIQSAKDDSDINIIVRRFGITGQMPGISRMPSYGDFRGVADFKSAMNVIRDTEEMFMALPSGLRKKFGNDPQNYLEFVTNPDNIEEMRKLGLAKPAVVTAEPIKAKADDDERSSTVRTGKAAKAAKGAAGDVGAD